MDDTNAGRLAHVRWIGGGTGSGMAPGSPTRAEPRANWGDSDHSSAFAKHLARDELWDTELRHQADRFNLPVILIDGSRDLTHLADDVARRFRLGGPLAPR
jgi:hypothetical protein